MQLHPIVFWTLGSSFAGFLSVESHAGARVFRCKRSLIISYGFHQPLSGLQAGAGRRLPAVVHACPINSPAPCRPPVSCQPAMGVTGHPLN